MSPSKKSSQKPSKSSPSKKSDSTSTARNNWALALIFIVTIIAVVLLVMLLISIVERRQEAKLDRPLTKIEPMEVDSEAWSINWPREFSSFKETLDDTTKTKYGGADPRDYLEETPANVILFGGYGFAKEYRQARGHEYTIEDVTETKRVGAATPATCWTCKSPDVPRLMCEFGKKELGEKAAEEAAKEDNFQEQLLAGAGHFYSQKFDDLKPEITHPIGCLDCHDPETMKLRISRPALIEAFARQGRDINKVSHQEMRSLVCAQCHVEYYFKGDGKYLTFPWDKGTKVEKIADYYEAIEPPFKDWTHAISGTPMVKMQHPDFEIYSTGIHAFRDVSCADCHMPYKTEGGVKVTNHHIQSPLLDVSTSCVICHRWSEKEIRERVTGIQDKVRKGRTLAETALVQAHFDIAAAEQAGATSEELKEARQLVRGAQLRWDFVAANNGMGFHSPQECTRILGEAVDLAQQSRLLCSRILAKHGYTEEVVYPDISTKEKAMAVLKQFQDKTPPRLLRKAEN